MNQAEGTIRQPIRPKLYYPFASAISKHADAVHQQTMGWVRHFRLLPDEPTYGRFDAAGLGFLVGRTHPHAGVEQLRLITDWHAWLFLRDDKGDESEAANRPNELSTADNRLLEVLEGAEPAYYDEPLAFALYDLCSRLLESLRANNLPGARMRRFLRVVREHLEATLWEASNRARGIPPNTATYVRMRRLTGGLSIVTELEEIIEGRRLPIEVREHTVVRRLTEASHNVVCWANDVVSLGKELRHGEVNNLVIVLNKVERLSLAEAVDRCVELHNAEMNTFVDLEARVPSFWPEADATLQHYISSLRARMRGVFDWSSETARYRETVANLSSIS
jgi:terpene synthase-like protein